MKDPQTILDTVATHKQANQYDQAQCLLLEGINHYPHHTELRVQLAVTLDALGHPQEAINHLQEAVRLHPTSASAHLLLGLALAQRQESPAAIDHLQRSLALSPNLIPAAQLLADLLVQEDRIAEALQFLQGFVACHPENTDTLLQLGYLYQHSHQWPKACFCFEEICRQHPNHPKALQSLGESQGYVGRYDEAIATFQKHLTLCPKDARSHFNLATLYLLLGNYAEGWPEYSWRKQCGFAATQYDHPLPGLLWEGQDLNGQSLFVYSEQGLGDVLQFARYLRLLKARGATVVVEVQPALQRLFQTCPFIDTLLVSDPHTPPAIPGKYHASFLDFPGIFNTTLDTLPSSENLLSIPDSWIQTWHARIPQAPMRVGLVWAGNPKHHQDRFRSCTLEDLTPLAAIHDIQWISLQKGPAATQQTEVDWELIDVGSQAQDFADTAAVLACLDLVITVDTAVAHLAGILGRPVWLLLSYVSDWRWLLDREDSPWYPSIRLFRQSRGETWPTVAKRLCAALHAKRALNTP
ncbi:tetratricopeptide repeat protein [Planctomycetota bacterium]